MEMAKIKSNAGDCKKTHRWVIVRADLGTDNKQYRIIGLGKDRIRVMSNAGTVFHVASADVLKVW